MTNFPFHGKTSYVSAHIHFATQTWQWEIPELNGGFWWKFPLPRCQAAVEEGDWDKIQVASGPSGLDFSVCLGTVNIS